MDKPKLFGKSEAQRRLESPDYDWKTCPRCGGEMVKLAWGFRWQCTKCGFYGSPKL